MKKLEPCSFLPECKHQKKSETGIITCLNPDSEWFWLACSKRCDKAIKENEE